MTLSDTQIRIPRDTPSLEKTDKGFNVVFSDKLKASIKRIKESEVFKESGGELAEWLHDTYERISKEVNWKTQKGCQVKFKDLPKANQSVMLRMAQAIQIKYLTRILLEIDTEMGEELI